QYNTSDTRGVGVDFPTHQPSNQFSSRPARCPIHGNWGWQGSSSRRVAEEGHSPITTVKKNKVSLSPGWSAVVLSRLTATSAWIQVIPMPQPPE
uniref:Uncharacterized protein n=1 Tax=Theropithecus gelada TaxID=9565 RepID=A0A8D2K5T5_THEGE